MALQYYSSLLGNERYHPLNDRELVQAVEDAAKNLQQTKEKADAEIKSASDKLTKAVSDLTEKISSGPNQQQKTSRQLERALDQDIERNRKVFKRKTKAELISDTLVNAE
jgi:FixJ family two-component response regulator